MVSNQNMTITEAVIEVMKAAIMVIREAEDPAKEEEQCRQY